MSEAFDSLGRQALDSLGAKWRGPRPVHGEEYGGSPSNRDASDMGRDPPSPTLILGAL